MTHGSPAGGAGEALRVVSLVPSVTETLLDWGVRPVAVTRFCEAPGIPTVGGTKNPDVDAIVALRPDLVVMDREENTGPDAARLDAAGVRVLATHVRSVGEAAAALAELAGAVGAEPPPPGGTPARGWSPATARVRVWVPIWRRPWMTVNGGTYGSSLLACAGFHNVCADLADPYPRRGPAAVAPMRPDFVLAPSEPYPFAERHRRELEAVAPVVFVDGRDLFWWGSRTPAACRRLEALALDLLAAQG